MTGVPTPAEDVDDATVAAVLAATADPTAVTVVDPPGGGEGHWAGAPSSVCVDGVFWLAYRLRRPVDRGRGFAVVLARSADGVTFETVASVTADAFGAASLERPALVPLEGGGWRLYVSCASRDSARWWVEALDAPEVAGLPHGVRSTVLAGDATTAWKDVVVHRDGSDWRMWACRHPLDGGAAGTDRMSSWYGTSADGLSWTMVGEALAPTPGSWDARGCRVSAVVRDGRRWVAFYDGRAEPAENTHERTGVAAGDDPAHLVAVAGPTPAGRAVRYLSIVTTPHGHRLHWEAGRADGAHDLRTAWVPRASS